MSFVTLKRSPSRWWIVGVVAIGIGLLVAWAIGPALIGAAYNDRAGGVLYSLISGREAHGVDFYIAAWRKLCLMVAAALAAVWSITILLAATAPRWRAFLHRAEQPLGPRDIFRLSLAAGLLDGILEVLAFGAKRYLRHDLIWVSPHVVWMSPLANVVLFGLTGILIIAIGRLVPVCRSARFVIAVLVFQMAVGATLATEWIQLPSMFALALGIAVSVSGALLRNRANLARLGVVCVRVGLGIVLLATAALVGRQQLRERRLTAARIANGADPINIVLIIWDTVRARSLRLYAAAHRTTPNLDTLAVRSVVYERANATAPYTLPSHASMFTGLLPFQLDGLRDRGLDARIPTLAESMASAGYATAGFVANTYFLGYPHGLNRGFAHYEDYPINAGEVVLSSAIARRFLEGPNHSALRPLVEVFTGPRHPFGYKDASSISSDFLRWLDRPRKQPFFAFLNYLDAHSPYLPPPAFAGRFGRPLPVPTFTERAARWLRGQAVLPEPRARGVVPYEESIAYLDAELGRVMRSLRSRGLLRNTVVIVTGDHGEEFGEHGKFGHSTDVVAEQIGVPLVIIDPRRAGGHVSEPVSLRDVPATIFALTGVANQAHLPGESLLPDAAPSTASSQHRVVYAQAVPKPDSSSTVRAVIAGDWKYILPVATGRPVLYNLARDPDEKTDLATAGNRAVLDSLAALMHETLLAQRPAVASCNQSPRVEKAQLALVPRNSRPKNQQNRRNRHCPRQ